MDLNIFHKIVLTFAFIIMGVGILNSATKNYVDPFSDIGNIVQRYDIVAYEPLISETPKFLSKEWLRNMMVSTFINTTQPIDTESNATVLLKVNNSAPIHNIYLLAFPEDAPIDSIQRDLENLDIVKYAEPNYEVELQVDHSFIAQARPNVNANTITLSSLNQADNVFKVAIIDSGIDRSHSDFQDKNIVTRSLIGSHQDTLGHGTHLAGIVFDIAPNAAVYSYKFTDGNVGKLSDVIRAMHMAIKDEVNLVNLSLGLPNRSFALEETINLLAQNNITVVAAAGNLNTDTEFYPAAFSNVISVGGLSTNGSKLRSSNFGNWLDYSILGQNIYSAAPNNEYAYLSGTSQSAAKVSGLIAKYYLDQSLQSESLEEFLNSQKFEREDLFKELLGIRLNRQVLTLSP